MTAGIFIRSADTRMRREVVGQMAGIPDPGASLTR